MHSTMGQMEHLAAIHISAEAAGQSMRMTSHVRACDLTIDACLSALIVMQEEITVEPEKHHGIVR